MVGIYKIQNLMNGKVYIGQSRNIKKRWTAHRNSPFNPNQPNYDSFLYRAIRKYGLDNFSFEVIEECKPSQLNERENYWIRFYQSNNREKGYNFTFAESESGGHPIALTLEKIEGIWDDLKNSELSQKEIAEKYGVSDHTISSINTGKSWIREDFDYPVREIPRGKRHDKARRTYQSKVNGKIKNHCSVCGKEISLDAKMCPVCFAKSARKTQWPERGELKELIRTKSFLEIGRMFNVSDSAIRKWCKFYHLPYKKTEIKKMSDENWELI